MSGKPEGFAFAAIGVDHNHIFEQTRQMLAAGCTLVAFHQSGDEAPAAKYVETFPQAKRVADERAILEDPRVKLVVGAGVNSERTAMAIRAMRHGKDVMLDKPAATTLDQLGELRRTAAETGRIVSILYSEHLTQRSTLKAEELVKAGAVGRVMQTVGLGPHREGTGRSAWFYDRARYGGILTDIASHQFEQFLAFTGAGKGEVVASQTGNFDHPDRPGFEDFGDALLSADNGATGYLRIDWFTREGLGVWGDGRLFILGTEGTIELRKYVDIAGRQGGDHLFLVDRKGTQHVDCASVVVRYGERLRDDVNHRTETAMPQERAFHAMELALVAQAHAKRIGGAPPGASR